MDKEPGQDEAKTEFLDSTCQALLRLDMDSTQQALVHLSQLRERPEGNWVSVIISGAKLY